MESNIQVEPALLTESQVQDIVISLAQQINNDHSETEKPIVLIGIMNGAVRLLSDLMKYVHVPCQVETIKLQTYQGMEQIEVAEVKHDEFKTDLSGKQVILVDDIIDSGNTMNAIKAYLQARYSGVRVDMCCLLQRRSNENHYEYVGYKVAEGLWVYGYGMDDSNGLNRNLNEIRIEKTT